MSSLLSNRVFHRVVDTLDIPMTFVCVVLLSFLYFQINWHNFISIRLSAHLKETISLMYGTALERLSVQRTSVLDLMTLTQQYSVEAPLCRNMYYLFYSSAVLIGLTFLYLMP